MVMGRSSQDAMLRQQLMDAMAGRKPQIQRQAERAGIEKAQAATDLMQAQAQKALRDVPGGGSPYKGGSPNDPFAMLAAADPMMGTIGKLISQLQGFSSGAAPTTRTSGKDAALLMAEEARQRAKQQQDFAMEAARLQASAARKPKTTRGGIGGLGRSQGAGGFPGGFGGFPGQGVPPGYSRQQAAPSYEEQLALKNQYDMERLKQLLAVMGKPKGETTTETTDNWVRSAGRFLNKPVSASRTTNRDWSADILRSFL